LANSSDPSGQAWIIGIWGRNY